MIGIVNFMVTSQMAINLTLKMIMWTLFTNPVFINNFLCKLH